MTKRIGWIALGAMLTLPSAQAGAQSLGQPGKPFLVVQGAADNTERNQRDANGGAPTAMDQGNSDLDRNITAQIRKAVVGRDDLSTNAKNAKIITQGGVVTLRGPVASAAERSTLAELASSTSGVRSVQNLLEVESK